MAMDESGKPNSAGSTDPAASSEDDESSGANEAQDRASRMNAAKAFYRAMYAGEDVEPDEFGLAAKQSPPEDQGGGGGGRSGPCNNCAYLETQLAEAQAKSSEYENLYKRMAADFENYRRRLDREREEFAGTGQQKAIEAILPALDDLDRAKMMLGNATDPKAILESLNLVYTRFMRCLEGIGVKPLEVIGEPFDPRNHEPVQEIETNQFADGVVMHELRKGYSYKDKILRPTLVNVASNPSGVVVAPEPPAEAKAEEPAAEAAAPAGVETVEKTAPAEEKAPEASEAAPQPEGGADALGDTLDALNDALKNLVGSDEEKGADLDSDGSASEDEKGKKQTVYDITDADTESADQSSVEKL